MKILLALDRSSASQNALEELAGRPWPADSSFEVVSVAEPSHLWTTPEVAQEAAGCADGVVRRAVEHLRSKGLTATGSALSGDAKSIILDRARTVAADLLAVGSHGVSLTKRFLLGNVAATVLRYAPCSVAVVREGVRSDGRGMKVLLATDGRECSEGAARSIAERPWPTGTEIRILSAVELILPAGRALFEEPFFDSAYLESARAEAMKRAQDAIAGAEQILSPTGLSVAESISVLVDTPQEIILHEAADWGADLIVLGSHGRHGVDRFLLGSASEAVAMHAGCSVEVIRKKSAGS